MPTLIVCRIPQALILIAALLAIGNDVHGAGEVWSNPGTITWLEAGWSQDTMAVGHTAQFVNPANCPVTNFGYATDPGDPGHTLFHTVALNAFTNKRQVQILIAGSPVCIFGKPKIIAVKLF